MQTIRTPSTFASRSDLVETAVVLIGGQWRLIFFTELWGKLIGVWIEGEKIALFGRALIIDDYLIRNRKGHRAVCSQQRGVWELQISLHQLPSGSSFAEKRTVARKMWKKKTQRLLLVFANKNKVWDNNTEQVVVAHNSASERKRTVMRHSLCTNALLYLKSPLWKKNLPFVHVLIERISTDFESLPVAKKALSFSIWEL